MAWKLLLTSDIGLLSLFTILFMLGMAGYIFFYVKRHVSDESKPGVIHNDRPTTR